MVGWLESRPARDLWREESASEGGREEGRREIKAGAPLTLTPSLRYNCIVFPRGESDWRWSLEQGGWWLVCVCGGVWPDVGRETASYRGKNLLCIRKG